MSDYCLCGIKYQQDAGGKYCPRCQKYEALEVVNDFQLTETAVISKEAVVTPGTGFRDVCDCDQCGSEMGNKCGSICPNCKWVKPCGING